ncbi:MAG TPA: adenylate/guanylate cyclase domain-containing protein [Gammaproteobacteria bacterium]
MAYDLFTKERSVIETAKSVLEAASEWDDETTRQYKQLLSAYEKLFKTTRRLVRLSDRNEAELNELAKSLNEKNKMLEGLSSKLSKYLPPQVYESIFSGKRDVSLATERKKLTVFFSDIKDFTDTTDDLEPEDLTFLLNDYLTEMSSIALEYGGTIDKFIGDAILIFFGDPETKGVKEDALACVKMAVAMQRRMVDLRAKWYELGYRRAFHKRVGINTGYCNVGHFGSNERMDYTIIGGEVNTAARMESITEPDGVTVTGETYALVKDHFDADALEPVRVKGIAREIRPFALQGIFDDADAEKRVIRAESETLRVFVDVARLDAGGREQAARQLDEISARLRGR